jgi:hypothetical protein
VVIYLRLIARSKEKLWWTPRYLLNCWHRILFDHLHLFAVSCFVRQLFCDQSDFISLGIGDKDSERLLIWHLIMGDDTLTYYLPVLDSI